MPVREHGTKRSLVVLCIVKCQKIKDYFLSVGGSLLVFHNGKVPRVFGYADRASPLCCWEKIRLAARLFEQIPCVRLDSCRMFLGAFAIVLSGHFSHIPVFDGVR